MSLSVVIAGLEPLGMPIAEALAEAGHEVIVLADATEGRACAGRLARAGVRVVAASPPWVFELSQLDLSSIEALVLCADDDNVNVDAALAMHREAPQVRLIVRLSDPALQTFVATSVAGAEVFSLANIAAPATVALAMAEAIEQSGSARASAAMMRQLVRGVMPRPSALFRSVFLAFVAMLLPASWFFARSLDLSFFDAMYFVWTTVLSVGYGDIALRDASTLAKAIGMAVMLLGSAFTAALVGLMADWLLTRRLGSLFVRVSVRMTNHVVVCGAGNFGVGVAELLHAQGRRVVVVESSPEAPNIQRLRALNIPVIIGDATVDDSLDLASAWSAAVLLAMTNHDAVNLHLGLRMQREEVVVPVIARLRSRQLSAHVDQHCGFMAISPMQTATEHVVALLQPPVTAEAGR